MIQTDVTVIGPGNWGSSLVAALRHSEVPVCEVVAKAKKHGTASFEEAQFDARILWLCVPDGAIVEATKKIIDRRRELGKTLRGQLVVHSSGALTIAALESARKAGAALASAHPVMSFPTRRRVDLRGVLFGVETRESGARRRLYALIRRFGGKPFAIQSTRKALYHTAGTFASPLLVSELSAAMTTARLAGLSQREARRWVGALAQATLQNILLYGETKSFSGPFARGDVATIRLHLQALAKHPILAEVYCSLARHAVEALPVERKKDIEALLKRAQ
jgi:predicted short-subunit dehydrogenase-like oxidoreductase (DUF2520 family)